MCTCDVFQDEGKKVLKALKKRILAASIQELCN